MKKTPFTLVALIMILAACQTEGGGSGCSEEDKAKIRKWDSLQAMIAKADSMYMRNSDSILMGYNKDGRGPKFFTDILKENAKIYVDAFKDDAAMQQAMGQGYTSSVWFSKETFLSYTSLIEQHKLDGVRLYFAKYTNNPLDPYAQAHAGRYTLVMVGTADAGIDAQGRPKHRNVFDRLATVTYPRYETTVQNYSSLCPNECEEDNW